jgi:DNA-directed RNA polymerase subunit RPC12/RpoP
MNNPKTYQLFCNNCHYKRFSNGSDINDLLEIPQSPIPRGAPYVDAQTKKIVVPKQIKRIKHFKCPKCGYSIKAIELKPIEEKNEQTDRIDGCEASFEG